jgi:hypothetical protein
MEEVEAAVDPETTFEDLWRGVTLDLPLQFRGHVQLGIDRGTASNGLDDGKAEKERNSGLWLYLTFD